MLKKHLIYSIDEGITLLPSLKSKVFDCVYIHLFTNDIRNCTPHDCVESLCFLIGKIQDQWPSCKIVVSTGLPRKDSVELNNKIYECNIMLLHRFLDAGSEVHICDNSGMGSRGKPISRFLSSDGIHLSNQGTSIFASNIKSTILEALGETINVHDTESTNHHGPSYKGRKMGYSGPSNRMPQLQNVGRDNYNSDLRGLARQFSQRQYNGSFNERRQREDDHGFQNNWNSWPPPPYYPPWY